MSDIVIVTADASHAAPSTLQTFLQGLGHTATLMDEGSVDATNLDGYDNIIAMRNSKGLTTLGDHLRGYIAKGKWVACGTFTGAEGEASNTTLAVLVGMPGPEEVLSSSESPQQVVRTLHPITGSRAVGETFEWLSGTEFSNSIPYDSMLGVRLSSLAVYPSSSAIHLFSATDLGITPAVPGGCGIFLGCIYNRSSYGADAPEIMNALLAARPGRLSGIVENADGQPASRTVRAHLRSTGAVSASTESSPADGTFTLQTWSEGEHTVIALPEAADENALVFDRVVPVQS